MKNLGPGISKSWFQDIFLCKKTSICGKLATMECEQYENKYIIKKIYPLLWKI